jgi:hypothetical protein
VHTRCRPLRAARQAELGSFAAVGCLPLPSHRPSEPLFLASPLIRVLTRKNNSRKINLYGKTKKSTHDVIALMGARTQPAGTPEAQARRRRRQIRCRGAGHAVVAAAADYRVLIFDYRVLIFPLQGTYFHRRGSCSRGQPPDYRVLIFDCRVLVSTTGAAARAAGDPTTGYLFLATGYLFL